MCFVAGTPVITPFVTKPIESLREGDLVLSRDERTGHQAFKSVVDTITTQAGKRGISELRVLVKMAAAPLMVPDDQGGLPGVGLQVRGGAVERERGVALA